MKRFFTQWTSFVLFVALFTGEVVIGQTTVTLGGLGSVTCPAVPTATWTTPPTGTTFSQISRGSVVTCASASTGISGSGFNGNLATNISSSKWYTFDVTANATTNFTLSGLKVQSQVSSATGTPNVSVQYSINGGTKTVLGSFTPTGSTAPYTISFTAVSVCAGQTLNIFIIPNNLNASGTTCRYENASTVTLTTITKATATFSGATAICNGLSTNLSVAVTGGTSPYTLTLDNSGGTATSATPVSKSVSPSGTTAYTATVTDANSCPATVTGNTQTVTVNPNPTASVLANGTGASTICSNQSGNLKVTVTGGTGPYSLVTSPVTASSITSGADFSVSPLSTQMYSLTSVTDANGCVSTGLSGTPTITVTNTWNAIASTGFSTGSTWSCGVAPIATADVTINNQSVTLSASSTVGSITFSNNGKLTLGANTLTTGSATGGSSAGWVVTDGAGKLTINSLSTSTPTAFPVGTASSYDPCTIKPTNSGINFSVKVASTLTNSANLQNMSKTASREWDITPVGTQGACALTFTPSVAPPSGGQAANPALGHYNSMTGWEEFKYLTYSGGTWSLSIYNGTFSPFAVGEQGGFALIALAVDFTAISAINKGAANSVNFATANEKDLTGYKIERSNSGTEGWSTIGEMKAKGAGDYTFTDANPLTISYYRVKGVELSGKEIVSKIVSVARSKNGSLKVYPTLASDKLTVSLDNPDIQPYIIFDLVGKMMQSGQIQGQKELTINTLSTGTYILKVGSETVKFTKN